MKDLTYKGLRLPGAVSYKAKTYHKNGDLLPKVERVSRDGLRFQLQADNRAQMVMTQHGDTIVSTSPYNIRIYSI